MLQDTVYALVVSYFEALGALQSSWCVAARRHFLHDSREGIAFCLECSRHTLYSQCALGMGLSSWCVAVLVHGAVAGYSGGGLQVHLFLAWHRDGTLEPMVCFT